MSNVISTGSNLKRYLLGSLLFLIFVGEPTVGLYSGLFAPPGLFVLGGLYIVLFYLYEALVVRYKLTYGRLIPLTFAIYSVLVTGLLHGELANYAKGQFVITTLIRIQCSLFPIFAYYLLNRFVPRILGKTPSVQKAGLVALLYFLLLTPTRKFGFITLLDTVHRVPLISMAFVAVATLALIYALKPVKKPGTFISSSFTAITWVLLVIACIPSIFTLLILLIAMPIVVFVYWQKPAFREAKA